MKQNCILPIEAEKLKKAFREKKISISKLFEMSSENRIKELSKYVPKENATLFVTKLERGYMMPRQKQAMKSVIYEMFGEKPLYKGISLANAKKMSEELNMTDLKKLSTDERTNVLSHYLDKDLAEKLSVRFDELKITGNLSLWESKVMGTETLRTDKQLKGSLAKLEALNDMGVLSPKEIEMFMQTFVESKLNINLSMDEAKKLSEMISKSTDLWDKLKENPDFTYKNEKVFREYLNSIKDIRAYEQELIGTDIKGGINTAIDYARASILSSYRILTNSFLYQIIPTAERFITKRILPASIGDKELEANINTMLKAKKYASTPTSRDLEFIKKQTAMATRIYRDTQFEIARMENLDDGFNYFGGEKFSMKYSNGKKMSETDSLKEKAKIGFDNYVSAVLQIPKWTAGGTDMLAANIQRADTSILMSKEIAYIEASKKTFKTDEDKSKWIDDRSYKLLKESYSFTPEDPQAAKIRASAILDANISNNTQASGFAEIILGMRKGMTAGGINFGKLIIPFAKIASTSISRGVQIGMLPFDAAKRIYNINQASKIADPLERGNEIRKNVSMMVGSIGLAATTILIASMLDDDDYIGNWDTLSWNEYNLAKARGASSGMVRIGGQWVPIRYLPLINIPLAGIMQARQAKAKGAEGIDVTFSYLAGMLGGLLDTPVLKEIVDIGEKMIKGSSSNETIKLLDSLGLNGKDLFTWAKVRALPSLLSYDMYNAFFPPEQKYDFLGNETGKNKKWYGFRADLSNDITLEFNRLNNTGNLPTISDPSREKIKEELGDEEYTQMLNRLKQNYADLVGRLIKSSGYNKLPDKDKKKIIDKIREKEIMDKLPTDSIVDKYISK